MREAGVRPLAAVCRSCASLGAIVVLAACLGALGNVGSAAAAVGDLTPAGCIGNSGTGPPSCIGADGLNGASSVAVSPDGTSVYATGYNSGALVVFRRAANGDLTPAGCIGNSGTGPPSCIGADGLIAASSVAVSPDGTSVYATGFGSKALVVFRRAANGDLTPAGCIGNSGTGPPSCIGADGLNGPTSVAVSPDGASVYVASATSQALVVFRRAANGDLTPAGCIGNSGTGPPSCIGADGLNGASSVAVSPDGARVYVASATSQALVVFRRAANGDLTPAGCIGNSGNLPNPGPPSCIGADGLAGAFSVALSPDGHSAYVASRDSQALVVFRRATPPGGGTGGGGGGTGGGSGGGGSSPATTVTAPIGNRKLTLGTTVPSGCLSKSASLKASVSAAVITGSSGNSLSFVRASFYIDRGVKHVHHHIRRHNGKKVTTTTVTYTANRTATSLPAKVSLKLGALKSGSHTLRVRVAFHKTVRRNGHKQTVSVFKTLSQKFMVCGPGSK